MPEGFSALRNIDTQLSNVMAFYRNNIMSASFKSTKTYIIGP